MAVALDAQVTDHLQNSLGSNTLATLTVGSGSNRGLLAVISWNSGQTITSVVWDFGGTAQAMTLVAGPVTNGAGSTAVYGLVNPASGNLSLRVDFNAGTDSYLAAVAYTGVDQTGGVTSFPGGATATGTSTTASVTVTSAVGDAVVASHTAASTAFSAVNNTSIYFDNGGSTVNGAANRAAGASPNVTMTATLTSGAWCSSGVNVKASGGASDTFLNQRRIFM